MGGDGGSKLGTQRYAGCGRMTVIGLLYISRGHVRHSFQIDLSNVCRALVRTGVQEPHWWKAQPSRISCRVRESVERDGDAIREHVDQGRDLVPGRKQRKMPANPTCWIAALPASHSLLATPPPACTCSVLSCLLALNFRVFSVANVRLVAIARVRTRVTTPRPARTFVVTC